MKFSISKNELYAALQIVGHAISSTSPQPSLRGIKIDAENDQLILTGSNADVSIQKTLEKNEDNQLNIMEEGSILIEFRYLNDIVRKIDSDFILVEIIDGSLTKFSGNSAVFKINGMVARDYPIIDFSKPATFIKMNTQQLAEIIEQTTFATSTKEQKPVLTGVNFKLSDNMLNCTATDSYRLAKKTIALDFEGEFNITIPSKSLNDVKSTMLSDTNEEIEIAMNNKKAQFIIKNMIFQTRLLDGVYPETDRLIPKEFKYTLNMNKDDLIHAIDRTIFIKNDNMIINRLQCSSDEVVLTNKSQEIGESIENLVASFNGDPLDISFSGTYVLEAIRNLKGNNLVISFTGEMKPFILKTTDDDTVLQLVLPVRTYN